MSHSRNQPHGAHPGKCRRQAKHDAERYITDCARVFTAVDQADRLHAESRKGGESPTKPDYKEGTQIVVRLDVHELANEDSHQKTADHVHEQGAERKPVWSKVLDPSSYEVAEHGTCGAPNCDEQKNRFVLAAFH
jgi:hypothetical protein